MHKNHEQLRSRKLVGYIGYLDYYSFIMFYQNWKNIAAVHIFWGGLRSSLPLAIYIIYLSLIISVSMSVKIYLASYVPTLRGATEPESTVVPLSEVTITQDSFWLFTYVAG